MKQVRTLQHRLTILTLATVMLLALLFVPQRASAATVSENVSIESNTTLWRYGWATLDTSTKTLKLTEDVAFSAYSLIFNSGSWTLDLNGKSITGCPAIAVKKDASLIIIGNGTINGSQYVYRTWQYCPGISIYEGATVTIRGGDIAISGSQAANSTSEAIDVLKGTLNIESGNLTVNAKGYAIYSVYGAVNISGGNLTVKGEGHAIYADNSTTVNISGGNITDNSANFLKKYKSTVTITGGVLSVVMLSDGIYTQTGGVIYNKTTGVVTARSLAEDYTIPANATLTVAEGETLTLNDGAVLTVPEGATFINNGSIYFNRGAKIVNNGTLTNNGTLYVDGEVHQHVLTRQYKDLGDGTHQCTDACLGCPIGYAETSAQEHTYQYASSGTQIAESCYLCDLDNWMAVSGEETVIYNGSSYTASIQGTPFNPLASMKLDYINESLESLGEAAPVDVGKYTVSLVAQVDGQNVCQADTLSFTIEPRQIIVTGARVYDKHYDGTQTLELSRLLVDGIMTGDDVSVTADMAIVDSADAGEYAQVTVSGITLTGEDEGNYTVDASAQVNVVNYWDEPYTVTILPAQVYIDALEQSVALGGALDQTKWQLAEYGALVEGHYVAQVTLIGDTSVATDFGSVEPSNAVILDEDGNDVTKNYNVTYLGALLRVECPDHDTFTNGFCSVCNGYEPAVWNEEKYVYEITNAGQLYWYAQYLNATNAEIKAELTKDIQIPENAPNWEPINASYVFFNGNYHTISGLKCIGGDMIYVGLFGLEGWWYEISNLHITNSYFEGSNYVGAVVACMNNGGNVTNCAVTDTTVKGDGYYVGGLVGRLPSGSIYNCYSAATVEGENASVLVGSYSSGNSTIENCYYLSETDDDNGGKTAEQFASGEVAYLLQSGVKGAEIYDDDWNLIGYEEGAHVWGQKIGRDTYPILGGMKVYKLDDGTYSNTMPGMVAQVGTTQYATVQEAVNNASGNYVKLLADSAEAVTASGDLYLDLNGYELASLTVTGGTLYGMDSTTDDYDCADGYGTIGSFTGTYENQHKTSITGAIRRYVGIMEEGKLSFHRIYAAVTYMSLRPSNAGFGYKAAFYGDQMIQKYMTAYGFNIWVTEGNKLSKSATDFAAGAGGNIKTLRIENILSGAADDAARAQTLVYADAFVTLTVNGQVIEIETGPVSGTLKDLINAVNADMDAYTETQLAALKNLVETYATALIQAGCELDNILN